MNILIYTQKSSYLGFSVGGAETSLRMLAEKLAQEGHHVVYLTEMKWGRFFKHKVKSVNGVHVHIVGFPDLPSKGIGFLLKLRKRIVEYFFYKTAEKLIRQHKIDLVHTYHEVPAMYRFLKLREKKNLDYVTVLRNGGKFWVKQLKKYPELYNSYRTVFNMVDSVNFNTEGMHDLFKTACQNTKMDVNLKDSLVQDIGLDFAQIRHRWIYPEGEPYKIVMASRFSIHQKRQELLIEAVSLLPEELSFRLILVGDGPNKKIAENLILEKNMADRVELISYMEQEKLWKLIASCHLYTHACDFEGLSKVIIEAMAMGVPVLASDVAPLNDYLKDGENGFLVKNTPQAWADRIMRLYKDVRLLESISRQSIDFIESNYLADVNVERYIRYFVRLKTERKRGA